VNGCTNIFVLIGELPTERGRGREAGDKCYGGDQGKMSSLNILTGAS